jgi:hypothetical protein
MFSQCLPTLDILYLVPSTPSIALPYPFTSLPHFSKVFNICPRSSTFTDVIFYNITDALSLSFSFSLVFLYKKITIYHSPSSLVSRNLLSQCQPGMLIQACNLSCLEGWDGGSWIRASLSMRSSHEPISTEKPGYGDRSLPSQWWQEM